MYEIQQAQGKLRPIFTFFQASSIKVLTEIVFFCAMFRSSYYFETISEWSISN